jgi:hypothetical protein
MAQLNFTAFQTHLQDFAFERLFVDVLGWNRAPSARTWQDDQAGETRYSQRCVAELGGVVAVQVVVEGGWPDEAQRMQVWRRVTHSHAENLLIFTNQQNQASQSQWYWVKRDKHPETGKPRFTSRRHDYFKGQPVDLFASKLQAMVVELSELDAKGRLPVLEAARRIAAALDVDKTTKKFFAAYQQQHLALLEHIEGIGNERDRRWYASVLLNRLMFVWFLQKKLFLDGGNADYLRTQLAQSQQRGANRFFGEFLKALFFEAFAKPEAERSAAAQALTGHIPYLNGGLFLPHPLELDEARNVRVGTTLRVADAAFAGIFTLFASFSWHLDDTPGGEADEINPDVLGYIFEKYINQKAFGAYYTRPEITAYLAERSIHKLILERIAEPAVPELGIREVHFESVPDLLAKMDAKTALKLVNQVLPSISILDPAVGSGAFLVAALKCLINVYYAVVGRAEMGASAELKNWLTQIQKDHESVGYYIKRRIVTDNLYGVDIMEEACEIAKLRLFLSMVASVRRVQDLEPLPNIDFNILPGNSLVGLMRVNGQGFDDKNSAMTQMSLFAQTKNRPFATLLADKNRQLDVYRHTAAQLGAAVNLRELRDDIDIELREATAVMNEMLRDDFEKHRIQFEQATWDAAKAKLGKPKKRGIERSDIDAQRPFHWGYVFDDIVQTRGGFDVILANPPWEVFQADEKEFFQQYDQAIQKKKLRIEDWNKQFDSFMKVEELRVAWLDYVSRFPHMARWYKSSPDYKNQTSTKLNLYLLFVERSFDLLRPGGHCGIVIPSGIYTDLGAKGLRDLLFGQTQIEGLFCFENRKEIFEGVHRSFKFVVLTFEKAHAPRVQQAGERNASAPPQDLLTAQALETQGSVTGTTRFPAAFMRHDVAELERFPSEGALWLEVDLIRRLSPDSHSVMEFKSELDVRIAEKMLQFPLLGERFEGTWNLKLSQEFNMTTDSHLFKTEPGPGRLPLYEGKMIHQFESGLSTPRYWIDEKSGRSAILGFRGRDSGQKLGYQSARFGVRSIGRSTDSRTLIAGPIPPRAFCGNSLLASIFEQETSVNVSVGLQAILNSVVFDYWIRQSVSANLNMFFIMQVPVPRQCAIDTRLVHRAARLICTTPEFDDLAKSVGLHPSTSSGRAVYGTTDPHERARLRAEIDGLVAHLYGLTEAEFVHILGTFPLVADPVKVAARNAYRDIERGLIL